MEYRHLGRTGLKVSEICLGTMQFGWTTDEATSFAVMDAYIEALGNFLDTADMYSDGRPGSPGGIAEGIIGRWMKARNNRRQIVLATKVRSRLWDGPLGEGLSRAHIMQACDDSLRRLQTDYIDLYQMHWYDASTPIEETLDALNDLVRAGKVRYIGCSNYPAWRLALALGTSETRRLARFISLQPHYNLVHRDEYERELEDLCVDQGIGVIPYSPLAGGFLSGKYRRDQQAPESARSGKIQKNYFNDRSWTVLAALQQAADDRGVTVLQMALAWLLTRPSVTSPIIGANTTTQLAEILGAVGLRLSPEEYQALDRLSAWKN